MSWNCYKIGSCLGPNLKKVLDDNAMPFQTSFILWLLIKLCIFKNLPGEVLIQANLGTSTSAHCIKANATGHWKVLK